MLTRIVRTDATYTISEKESAFSKVNFCSLQTSIGCFCRICCGMAAAARQQALITIYIILLLHLGKHNASAQPSLQSSESSHPPLPAQSYASNHPATAPQLTNSSATSELEVLNQLGWQQMYNPSGYCINASLPSNCSSYIWQSLGCLTSLTNLTLIGTLPSLPDSWGTNNSFSSLRALDLSLAQLNGTLPASWGSPSSFPRLRCEHRKF